MVKIHLLCAIAILFFVSLASADTMVLRNGTSYLGHLAAGAITFADNQGRAKLDKVCARDENSGASLRRAVEDICPCVVRGVSTWASGIMAEIVGGHSHD